MPDLSARKVGIVACSGEELAEGTVSRLAALKVLHDMRPRDTVTICLPLFLAGGAGDRAFAKVHPTIAVDGCDLRCAARATEMLSAKPAASIVVSELVAQQGLGKPEGRRRLNEAGMQAVGVVAERVTALVDTVLGAAPSHDDEVPKGAVDGKSGEVTCSCGSGVSVSRVTIRGRLVEILALPLVFQKFPESGRGVDEAAVDALLETVKIYNDVPRELESDYRSAIAQEYAAFLKARGQA